MGASDFMTRASGDTPEAAFREAVSRAQYEDGHGGYTGTIAEKREFVFIKTPEGMSPREYAQHLMDKGDSRVDNKWGPAGCVELEPGSYLFFGWASS